MRFFAGLSHEEAGQVLGISAVTVKRHWRYARAWLHRELQTGDESPLFGLNRSGFFGERLIPESHGWRTELRAQLKEYAK